MLPNAVQIDDDESAVRAVVAFATMSAIVAAPVPYGSDTVVVSVNVSSHTADAPDVCKWRSGRGTPTLIKSSCARRVDAHVTVFPYTPEEIDLLVPDA